MGALSNFGLDVGRNGPPLLPPENVLQLEFAGLPPRSTPQFVAKELELRWRLDELAAFWSGEARRLKAEASLDAGLSKSERAQLFAMASVKVQCANMLRSQVLAHGEALGCRPPQEGI